ncbi:MAG: sigma-70 family RNA polymerase sigma factor [Alphaproteobacteria bacterium]
MLEVVPALRAFARTLTRDPTEADDLVQDTLVKALGHLDQFAPGTNLRAWLFTIERNTFYTTYRRKRRETPLPVEEMATAVSHPKQEWTLKMKAANAALQQLPEDQKEALVLVSGAGLSYEDAAAVCGCAIGTIKSRVSRARLRMLSLLEVDSHEEFLKD